MSPCRSSSTPTTGHLASLYRRAYTSSLKTPEADLDDVEHPASR